ncbi:MAG: chemotaxis protein CheW [Thermoanaerobaculales bacterium]
MAVERATLIEKIRQTESELSRLWRQLEKAGKAAPIQPINALQVAAADLWYLIPVDAVREVIQMVWPQPLVGSPDWVLGTFQLGSRTVPIIDLGFRLGGTGTALSPDLALLIVDSPTWIGLMVSAVGNVVSFDARSLSPPHPGVPQAPFLLGTRSGEDGEVMHLLSVATLASELD